MEDAHIYAQQDLGQSMAMGECPALLIVDFVNGFLDPDMFGGGNIPEAAKCTVPLLEAARAAERPVIFTRIVYAEDGSDAGVWCEKAPRLAQLTECAQSSQMINSLAPLPGELVVRKTQASAFFGTGLAASLISRRADSLIVAGCTTSGCVRASVVDAISYNFRPHVVRDCVGDRAIGPHEANLFDIEQKYGQLLSVGEAISLF